MFANCHSLRFGVRKSTLHTSLHVPSNCRLALKSGNCFRHSHNLNTSTYNNKQVLNSTMAVFSWCHHNSIKIKKKKKKFKTQYYIHVLQSKLSYLATSHLDISQLSGRDFAVYVVFFFLLIYFYIKSCSKWNKVVKFLLYDIIFLVHKLWTIQDNSLFNKDSDNE